MSATSSKSSKAATPAKRRHKRSLAPNFGAVGVISLVDILANSLIVMILLIFITIKVNQEVMEQESQSMQDVSVMMSRKLAPKVVSNSLATSRPAFLHDYYSSPLDANPDENLMPVLELHKNFVRLYYSKKTISFSNLLQQENALDYYLENLNDRQKNSIRLDVYDVRPYYVLMSILKYHGISIRHWHLLGYDQPPPEEDEMTLEKQDELVQNEKPKDEKQEEEGGSAGSLGDFPDFAVPDEGDRSPNEFSDEFQSEQDKLGKSTDEMLSELAPELTEEERQALREFFEAMPSMPLNPDGQSPRMDPETLRKLLKELAQSLLNQPKPDFQLRIPDGGQQMPMPGDSNGQPQRPTPEALLTALLEYLYEMQTYYDARIMSDLNENQLLMLALSYTFNPDSMIEAELYPMALRMMNQLFDTTSDVSQDAGISVEQKLEQDLDRPNALTLKRNEVLSEGLLSSNHLQDKMDIFYAPAEQTVEITLRRYPSHFGGEKVKVGQGMFLAMPPSDISGYEWRLAAVSDYALKDIVLGYVYASVDESGALITPLPENALSLNGRPVPSIYEAGFLNPETLILIVFLLLSATMMVFYLRVNRS